MLLEKANSVPSAGYATLWTVMQEQQISRQTIITGNSIEIKDVRFVILTPPVFI
jgi:hypothetical protein